MAAAEIEILCDRLGGYRLRQVMLDIVRNIGCEPCGGFPDADLLHFRRKELHHMVLQICNTFHTVQQFTFLDESIAP